MNRLKDHSKKWFYWLTLGVILIVVYKILDQFTNVTEGIGNFFKALSPIISGAFIGYILYLPCRKIERSYKKSKNKLVKSKARPLSILTVYVIAIILIILIIRLIFPILIESTTELIENSQGYIQEAIKKYQQLPEDSIWKNKQIFEIAESIKNIDLTKYINVDKISEYAKEAIGMVTTLFNTFVAIIVSIYMLAERDRICNFLKRAGKAMLKDTTYRSLSKYFNSANEIFSGFITSQLIDGVIVSILSTILLSVLGVKYAPLLGFVIGMFNLIPYVGAIIGVGITVIITLITGGITQAIWMLILITILQQIDANIINPKIVGNSLKISPLLVITAVMIGGTYWGVLGMFVSVPISALIKILAEDYIDFKMKMKKKIEN